MGEARAAPGQDRTQCHLLTFFPSVQVKPPFRDTWMRSTTVPDTLGTGNSCSCRATRFTPVGWVARLLLSAISCASLVSAFLMTRAAYP
jgi:hypothetical protein